MWLLTVLTGAYDTEAHNVFFLAIICNRELFKGNELCRREIFQVFCMYKNIYRQEDANNDAKN